MSSPGILLAYAAVRPYTPVLLGLARRVHKAAPLGTSCRPDDMVLIDSLDTDLDGHYVARGSGHYLSCVPEGGGQSPPMADY